MSNIYIRKSEIEETDEGNICLSAFIFENDAERKMKFEFPEKYKEYLTTDRADPFVAALVWKAMKQGSDIECEDPVSEKLLYSLNHLYIPALTFEFHDLKDAKVKANCALPCATRGATGVIVSGENHDSKVFGILDSVNEYKPLVLITDGKQLNDDFMKDLDERKIFVLPVVHNLDEYFSPEPAQTATIRRLSAALALQGLFSEIIYIPQYNDREFKLDPSNCDRYEVLSTECFSTDSLRFLLTAF